MRGWARQLFGAMSLMAMGCIAQLTPDKHGRIWDWKPHEGSARCGSIRAIQTSFSWPRLGTHTVRIRSVVYTGRWTEARTGNSSCHVAKLQAQTTSQSILTIHGECSPAHGRLAGDPT